MFGRNSAPSTDRSNVDKEHFLEKAKEAREERARKHAHEKAAIKIQTAVRSFLGRKHFIAIVSENLDSVIGYSEALSDYTFQLKPAEDVYTAAKTYLMFCCKEKLYTKRFDCLCKYILHSLNSDVIKLNYLSLLLNKQLSAGWLNHINQVLSLCHKCLRVLKPDNQADMRSINTILTVLISFTSAATWKILSGKAGEVLRAAMNQICVNITVSLIRDGLYQSLEMLLFNGVVKIKPCFKSSTLTAVCTLLTRMFQSSGNSESCVREFLLHIASVPALFLYIKQQCNDMYMRFISERYFSICLDYLSDEDQLQALAVTLEGNRTLCLIANFVQLGLSEVEGITKDICRFAGILTKLLDVCGQFMVGKKTSKSHWHPILGWASKPFNYNDAVPSIIKQVELLWEPKTIRLLFADMIDMAQEAKSPIPPQDEKKTLAGLLKKKTDKKKTINSLSGPAVKVTCLTCVMYQTAFDVLIEMQTELLTGLAFNQEFLKPMWLLIRSLGGPTNPYKIFLDPPPTVGGSSPNVKLSALLNLFCDASMMLFMVLDDVEVYEKQQPFSLEDLMLISDTLNQFVFKAVWQNIIDWQQAESDPIFTATHTLLMLLYERDSRRPFCPPENWYMKEIKPSQFISSVDKGDKKAHFLLQKMPHIVPHTDRVVLFRKYVLDEKMALGITEASSGNISYITVYRRRLLEDGYRQLAAIPNLALKGIIRVKFFNDQGLDEAGIDQDGVFKEFLEETIKKVFDPSLGLFKLTVEQKLYPSPSSFLQDNHLSLFEFVGRMLGKAVYEGIVVDVPFAPFFLTQVLDNMKNSMYSYLDELPSLDPELYRNLTYVKHYEGDVRDLELTFSYDEDFMGTVKNYELKPGGKALAVTNENKISYVHYMARFKMHTQIKEQISAFTRGFKSIINYDWLRIFSTPEVQKLMSGDTVDIDLDDLRKHTQYYGGFHNNHKVINWLWDILKNDFTEQERSQFLKFVTSCSKPPLLGFSHLDPPFSIRCVEMSDDQDTGDTIGSVLKGFFSIRKNEPVGRLPTSSTCFNLLKLPNYTKRSTLRDKLKYSIHNNTGFELS